VSRSKFDPFNSFIRRFHRLIIVAWIVVLVLSATLIPSFFAGVSYDITAMASLGGPKNTESQVAQNIINAQFPSLSGAGKDSIILVIQDPTSGVYSDAVKNAVLQLDSKIGSDPSLANYTGASSIYSTELDVLNSTLPSFILGVASIASNVKTVNQAVFSLEGNLSALSAGLFQMQQGVNQTSQLVYGIPAAFVEIWLGILANQTSVAIANQQANATIFAQTGSFGGDQQSIGYYTAFFGYWNASVQTAPTNRTQWEAWEAAAVSGAVSNVTSSLFLDNETKGLVLSVANGLNVTNWNQGSAIGNLTVNVFASQVPSSLTSSIGVTPSDLVLSLYNLGPSPSAATLTNLTIPLIANGFSGLSVPIPGLSVTDLVNASSSLGPSPSQSAVWNLAANFFSNTTASAFAASPVFTVNATSLGGLLSGLTPDSSVAQVASAINATISEESFSDYPLVLSKSLTQNFVGAKNDTMIVVFSLSSAPSSGALAVLQQDVKNSDLSSLATTYVTGGSLIAHDAADTFVPVLGVTLVPGIVVSMIIVGILFAAPLAALLPLLLGGLSIVIAYAAIYLGVVVAGGGQITFMTPTLVTLLMLGLAVDYSVLQLRRTKEERTKGRSKEESVATSVRWAGQAVLTAGITVVVAYVILAVVNVPIFNDVGIAIALGVSILLLASMTLLPSLELLLGDTLFWPRLKVNSRESKPGLLAKVSDVTLKRKLAIALVISLFAAGAVAVTASTPTGIDILKLLPNFQSNQGLTVITESLGSGTVSPTQVLVTMPSPIVYGNNQFNMTLLDQIELISSKVAASSDVASLAGPTRPYGSPFNFSSIGDMSEPLSSQYLEGMLSYIGRDNTTALISIGFTSESMSAQSVASLEKLESEVKSTPLMQGVVVHYGGTASQTNDNEQFIGGLIPEVTIILVIVVYLILFFQLRSAFTPFRLVFTILCSVAFSLALLAITFDYLLKLPILNFVDLFVIVTMLGVGIDYDIFYVTRIREEILNGKTDDEAIKTATTKVWVTIFGLGLILSSVFASLLVTGIAVLQEIGLAVSAAVLIDVSVVILLFVPSLMALAERFNWWPSKAGRSSEKKA
jgi:RND superfamily putative drug exporter